MSYGASPEEWEHFSSALGLTADLLPVVSNPEVKISALSKMKALGKTPSQYNRKREAAGLSGWTSLRSMRRDIENWANEPDYGMCIQTRTVRAFDIDCEDAAITTTIIDTITGELHALGFPTRFRENSSKCLLAFTLPGDLPKRIIRMKGGIIELLATGQQFVACGTHPSGVKYQWLTHDGDLGLPEEFPELTLEELDRVWAALEAAFAVEPSTTASPSKQKTLTAAITNDPVAQYLIDNALVKSTEKDGRLHVTCPFEHEHTSESADSATTYWPANTGGYQFGHFHCLHAHCEHRTDQEFKDAIGLPYHDPVADFEVLPPQETTKIAANTPKPRFEVVPAHEFAVPQPQAWLIKKVLPKADLIVVYGESTAGKSFFVLDLAGAIARGAAWRGHRVTKGNVVYIAAEGAGGMRGRLRAYSDHIGTSLADINIGIIADAPNFMELGDVKNVLLAIKAFGEVSLIVVDTFAQVMAGANENAGEDVGRALKHCKALSKHTGATVLLVHHAGKDTSKGARGWSGLRAAADAEMEIIRDGDDRTAILTKLKDGEDGTEFGFKLKVVDLGPDPEEMNERVTSCAIEEVAAKPRVSRVKTKGGNEKLVLKALGALLKPGTDKTSVHELTTEVVKQIPFDADSSKSDRRRDLVYHAIGVLRDSGQLEVVDGAWVKLPTTEEELA